MTSQNKSKLYKILEKLVWVIIPFVITGIITIVLMTYNTNMDVQILKKQYEDKKEMDQKILSEYEKKNDEAESRLSKFVIKNDEAEKKNDEAHQMLLIRLGNIETKVDKIWNSRTFGNYIDMTPYKPVNFTATSKENNLNR